MKSTKPRVPDRSQHKSGTDHPQRTTAISKPGEHTGLIHLYGRRPILEALRLSLVQSIEITRRAHGQTVRQIRELAEQRRVPIKVVETLPGEEGLTIQGIRALAQPPETRRDLRRFLESLPESPAPFLLMLDSVTDPHNLGAILRTAEAAAVSAVIMRDRRQASLNETVVKTSAGAAYLIPIFEVVNLSQSLRWLSEEGFWSVATVISNNSQSYRKYHWSGKTLLILGAEGTGVSELLRKSADVHVSIPMFGQIDSLNVSAAAAVLLFEAAKGRGLE